MKVQGSRPTIFSERMSINTATHVPLVMDFTPGPKKGSTSILSSISNHLMDKETPDPETIGGKEIPAGIKIRATQMLENIPTPTGSNIENRFAIRGRLWA